MSNDYGLSATLNVLYALSHLILKKLILKKSEVSAIIIPS